MLIKKRKTIAQPQKNSSGNFQLTNKTLIFDTGPIISLVTNNLLWILEPLKKQFNGEFIISKSVEKELITKPLIGKKFKFEALYVSSFLKKNIIKISQQDVLVKTNSLLKLANQIYTAKNKPMHVVDRAEMETLALASQLKSKAVVIDERTTRLIIENPKKLAKLLSKKLHTKIKLNMKALREFQKQAGKINIIRSVDLLIYAFEKKILDKFIPDNNKKQLLDAIIWGAKTHGCSIAVEEIKTIMKLKGY